MEDSDVGQREITIDQLVELREKTETISQFLHDKLVAYLRVLQPLLSPVRVLGRYVGAKEDTIGADQALQELQAKYREISKQKPFTLPPDLEPESLALLENALDLYSWEYTYEAKGARETRTVSITSPVCWILTYRSSQSLPQMRQILAGTGERRAADVRNFIVSALLMQMVFEKFPSLVQILTDLRFHVQTEHRPDLGTLPLTTVRCSLPSFRPADSVIVTAARLAGVPAFVELVDLNALAALNDPLKIQLEELLR